MCHEVTHTIFGIAEDKDVFSPGSVQLQACVGDLPLLHNKFLVIESNRLIVPLIFGADYLKGNNIKINIFATTTSFGGLTGIYYLRVVEHYWCSVFYEVYFNYKDIIAVY